MSVIALGLATALWITSYIREVTAIQSVNGSRYEIVSRRGSLLIIRFDGWTRDPHLTFFVVPLEPESPAAAKFFKQTPWWHADNSWWQGIGWTVRQRARFAGFELARGTYWPPFACRVPTVRFELLELPYALIAAFSSIAPLCWFAKRFRRSARVETDAIRGFPIRFSAKLKPDVR